MFPGGLWLCSLVRTIPARRLGGPRVRQPLTASPPPTSSNGSAEMAAVYYERIDVEGHHYGPSSQQRKNALKEVDRALSKMITLIKVSDVHKPSSWGRLERASQALLAALLRALFNASSLGVNLYVLRNRGCRGHVKVKVPFPHFLFWSLALSSSLWLLHSPGKS